ncbi:hypothetical protein PFICI_04291 [Pestalotiopsis fici W106-1]|uniref:Heterokaryon incompatibility domain-containing protein n=1 Tax=Pestalotiopsis fici (strain W106-1 / CGMCC3.15140) TaxID=1229662 RepID=W3X8P4_PESFW|nr:uncharacterized protein PFICI_04291 [Pestalotiopsis fici W106-1]ETS82415.1 hypothetical protein PFICI_04291 [Pestalotiopsis fici W106-1]
MDAKIESPPDGGQGKEILQQTDDAHLCEKCFELMKDLSDQSQDLADWDWRLNKSAIAARYAANLNPANLVDSVRNMRSSSKTGIFIAELGNRFRQAIDTNCTLCRLLLASKVETTSNESRDDGGGDELQGFLLRDYFLFNHRRSNPLSSRETKLGEMIFLAVVPANFDASSSEDDQKALELQTASKGCLVLTNKESEQTILNAVTVSPHFEPSVVLEWFDFCRHHHDELCQQDAASTVAIDGFRWIDCDTKMVETAQAVQPYIALSYVWGPPSPSSAPSEPEDPNADQVPLPEKLPATIEDAITVTKQLGFRYLWVDRYCINQKNPEIKLKQIQQMDLIYQNAELAIIAAAGTDERHGLPGVGGKERASARGSSVKYKNIDITSTLKDPQGVVRDSRWYTRGWTFQEGLLSRRRLVFTEEQVYFECNAMNCFESISGSLTSLSERDNTRAATFMRPGLFESHRRRTTSAVGAKRVRSVEEMDFSALFDSYLIWSQQYSARNLSFDGDSMNAFLGLIHKIEKIPKPLLQHWAIPYPHSDHKLDPLHAFAEALSWRHKYSCWDDDASKRPRRRTEFPSWSWVGWASEIVYPTKDALVEERLYGENIEITRFRNREMTLGETGRGSKWSADKKVSYGVLSSNNRVLTIHSRVIQASDLSYDAQTKQWKLYGHPATVAMSQGPPTEDEFYEQLRQDKQWACVLLGSASSQMVQVITALILERSDDDDSYVRSGLLIAKMPAMSWTGRLMKTAFQDLTREAKSMASQFQTFNIK